MPGQEQKHNSADDAARSIEEHSLPNHSQFECADHLEVIKWGGGALVVTDNIVICHSLFACSTSASRQLVVQKAGPRKIK